MLVNFLSLTFSASSSRIFPAWSRNLSSCISREMQRFCQSTLATLTAPDPPPLSSTSAMARIQSSASGLRLRCQTKTKQKHKSTQHFMLTYGLFDLSFLSRVIGLNIVKTITWSLMIMSYLT